jgi:hypothetical protein
LQQKQNITAAQASSSTRSCHGAIEHYQNCQRGLNLLSYHLVVSHAFAREGEDVVVACSREEKVVGHDVLAEQDAPLELNLFLLVR